jgi:hypothetical protein
LLVLAGLSLGALLSGCAGSAGGTTQSLAGPGRLADAPAAPPTTARTWLVGLADRDGRTSHMSTAEEEAIIARAVLAHETRKP